MSSEVQLEDILFIIGDEVIFECGGKQNNTPRYDFNDDQGSTDIWAQGTITHVDNEIIQVEYTIENYIGTGNCTWPNFEHDSYDPFQWWFEGYLQLISKQSKCECGAEKTYGTDTTHVSWCPKY